jgi:hypothetical protein
MGIVNFFSMLLLVFAIFSPVIIIGLECEFGISAMLPRFIPLLRILFSKNPYQRFREIATKCYDSRNYYFGYDSKIHNKDWYDKEIRRGESRLIGRRLTLKIANRILEFRIWLIVRECSNYGQLLEKAIEVMQSTGKADFVFISSPLYAHPRGLSGGVKELRRSIVDLAENNQGAVFNQIPFLDIYLPKIKGETKNKFETFYEPIIASSVISEVAMNSGWEKSLGCKTEFDLAHKYAKRIRH